MKQQSRYWCETGESEKKHLQLENFLINLSGEIMGVAYIMEASYNFYCAFSLVATHFCYHGNPS